HDHAMSASEAIEEIKHATQAWIKRYKEWQGKQKFSQFQIPQFNNAILGRLSRFQKEAKLLDGRDREEYALFVTQMDILMKEVPVKIDTLLTRWGLAKRPDRKSIVALQEYKDSYEHERQVMLYLFDELLESP